MYCQDNFNMQKNAIITTTIYYFCNHKEAYKATAILLERIMLRKQIASNFQLSQSWPGTNRFLTVFMCLFAVSNHMICVGFHLIICCVNKLHLFLFCQTDVIFSSTLFFKKSKDTLIFPCVKKRIDGVARHFACILLYWEQRTPIRFRIFISFRWSLLRTCMRSSL